MGDFYQLVATRNSECYSMLSELVKRTDIQVFDLADDFPIIGREDAGIFHFFGLGCDVNGYDFPYLRTVLHEARLAGYHVIWSPWTAIPLFGNEKVNEMVHSSISECQYISLFSGYELGRFSGVYGIPYEASIAIWPFMMWSDPNEIMPKEYTISILNTWDYTESLDLWFDRYGFLYRINFPPNTKIHVVHLEGAYVPDYGGILSDDEYLSYVGLVKEGIANALQDSPVEIDVVSVQTYDEALRELNRAKGFLDLSREIVNPYRYVSLYYRGTEIISSSIGCLWEHLGDGAFYISPYNIVDIEAAIEVLEEHYSPLDNYSEIYSSVIEYNDTVATSWQEMYRAIARVGEPSHG